ncbi:unnamed protein product [Protopolystoma xenopodis]|uniref:Uncharacterized protein n=1 Tax=Protopolystoma xenopodis TaxID=117903 RepID=A0A3S5ANJ1_9PLAT|nr:unnamed protein product [Protopolystoma xenopodis]
MCRSGRFRACCCHAEPKHVRPVEGVRIQVATWPDCGFPIVTIADWGLRKITNTTHCVNSSRVEVSGNRQLAHQQLANGRKCDRTSVLLLCCCLASKPWSEHPQEVGMRGRGSDSTACWWDRRRTTHWHRLIVLYAAQEHRCIHSRAARKNRIIPPAPRSAGMLLLRCNSQTCGGDAQDWDERMTGWPRCPFESGAMPCGGNMDACDCGGTAGRVGGRGKKKRGSH